VGWSIFGVFISIAEKQIHQVVKFRHKKKTVTTNLFTYLYILNHFGWNGDWQ
jgi:hypothetical protein